MKYFIHFVVILFLTVITQIGGLLYFLSFLIVRPKSNRLLKQIIAFLVVYTLSTIFVVPIIAETFGRESVLNNSRIQPHSLFYTICNRNYVKPELNDALAEVSESLIKLDVNLKIIYLDASFPFFDGFPLLPHLSHDDGEKIDITLIYESSDGKLTNKKKSISGYGSYEGPDKNEVNQTDICKTQNWFYDFPKYLTFGEVNNEILFSRRGNKYLLDQIIKNESISKIFIEPHLKTRLNLNHKKVRFHGCQAVRHDDHIHIQL